MSFLEILSTPETSIPIRAGNSKFVIEHGDVSRLELQSGLVIRGFANNPVFRKKYQELKNPKESLAEFTLWSDFSQRYAKDKPTRRYACNEGDTVVEVGAYLGYHAIKVAQKIGKSGRLYAVEMVKENYELLKHNLEDNFPGTAYAIHAAIHTDDGYAEAHIGGEQINGLRLDVIERSRKRIDTKTVPTRSLESLLRELGLNRVTLLTLQLNGTEPQVLRTLNSYWQRIDNFAVAANYDRDGVAIRHEIASIFKEHGYAVEIYDNWVYATRTDSNVNQHSSPIFIGGCGRSGTTLLRTMLDSHSNICCGPESNLVTRPSRKVLHNLTDKFSVEESEVERIAAGVPYLPQFCEAFFSAYAARNGKRRWAEKTPANVCKIGYIFDNFPNAKFIHVVRDGRDVACSLRTHPKFRIVDGIKVPTNINNDLEDCIDRWVNDVSAGLAWADDSRVLLVRYEQLISSPDETMRRVLAFLDEPWDDKVLAHHELGGPTRDASKFPNNEKANRPISVDSLGRWQDDMSPEEIALFKGKANPLMIKLGYVSSENW